MKKITNLLFILLALALYSCDVIDELDELDSPSESSNSGIDTGTGTGSGTGTGTGTGIYNGSAPTGIYWKRNDGVRIAYLSLSGSTAKACDGVNETLGTFNSSKPSMTFIIGKDIIEFPLLFTNGVLYVGAPDQAVNTHNAQTQYVVSNTYTCGSNSGGGSVVSPEKGNVIFWSNLKNSDKRFYGLVNITYTEKGYKRSMNISNFGPSSPGCNVPNTPGASLDPGSYNWTAEWQFYNAYGILTKSTRGGNFTITSKVCTSVEIK